jgi:DinB superfamily
MSESLHADLAACLATFRENRAVADRLTHGITPEQFNWKPGPDRWSAAQCFVHLKVSARMFADRIEEAIHQGRASGLVGSGPFRYGPIARWVARAVDPAGQRKYRAPAKFVPTPDQMYDMGEVLTAFHAAGERWQRCLQAANGLDLARVKVRSPALPIMRFPLGAIFGIQASHERRHLNQAAAALALQQAQG